MRERFDSLFVPTDVLRIIAEYAPVELPYLPLVSGAKKTAAAAAAAAAIAARMHSQAASATDVYGLSSEVVEASNPNRLQYPASVAAISIPLPVALTVAEVEAEVADAVIAAGTVPSVTLPFATELSDWIFQRKEDEVREDLFFEELEPEEKTEEELSGLRLPVERLKS